jgi:hypothetical protein
VDVDDLVGASFDARCVVDPCGVGARSSHGMRHEVAAVFTARPRRLVSQMCPAIRGRLPPRLRDSA